MLIYKSKFWKKLVKKDETLIINIPAWLIILYLQQPLYFWKKSYNSINCEIISDIFLKRLNNAYRFSKQLPQNSL